MICCFGEGGALTGHDRFLGEPPSTVMPAFMGGSCEFLGSMRDWKKDETLEAYFARMKASFGRAVKAATKDADFYPAYTGVFTYMQNLPLNVIIPSAADYGGDGCLFRKRMDHRK